MSSGTKRGSPGDDVEKDPLGEGVVLSEDDAKKLDEVQKMLTRVDLIIDRQQQKLLQAAWEKRRAITKTIQKYWPMALMNHHIFSFQAQQSADQHALSYLEDVWVERDPQEPRCFTIEFHFKENPFFSDSVLKKEYKFIAPPSFDKEVPDADGLKPSALDFSWERDVEPQTIKINWKSDDKNLTKLYPRILDEDDPENDPREPGSIFNWFEQKEDPYELGVAIAHDIFPDATEYFLGKHNDDDSEDEEDEEDDDEAEIDLEKPIAKKPKKA